MLKKLGLYYNTLKYLRPIQIRYRLWYLLRSKLRTISGHSYSVFIPRQGHHLELAAGIPKPSTFNLHSSIPNSLPVPQFTFLNQSQTFEGDIDWNFAKYGKLWAYNLNYFDYLAQRSINKEEGVKLIGKFIDQIEENEEGLEPYPTALRGMNWIKFLSKHQIKEDIIDASLYAQYQILLDNIEYHVLGNHLLENGFSLLFGGYYFRDEEYLIKSKKILRSQLDEQILNDGAHFERSPMYHQIILERLLDGINLLSCNRCWKDERELLSFMKAKAQKMMGWLQKMSFRNGDIPQVNDAAAGIAPGSKELKSYAQVLGVSPKQISLDESGYRKFQTGEIELLIDAGKIGPDYQPGHAHSDTLSFILYCHGLPVIIDTGTSTYEANEIRDRERGTAAHNTVKYGDAEQSEVWKAFRVGRRAHPVIIDEGENFLQASHDGYQHFDVTHIREWKITNNGILITDSMQGEIKRQSTAYFHIHPDIKPYRKADQIFQVGNITLSLAGALSAEIKKWPYPQGYNRFLNGYKIEVVFDQELKSRITY